MRVDQKQVLSILDAHNASVPFGGATRLGQVFTAGVSANLVAVDIALRRKDETITDAVTITIEAVTADLPNGSVLATAAATIAGTDLYTDKYRIFHRTLAVPMAQTLGTKYAIVATGGGTATDAFRLYDEFDSAGALYTGGHAVGYYGGVWYLQDPATDFYFVTYTDDTETAPTLPSSLYGVASHPNWDSYSDAGRTQEFALAAAMGAKFYRFDMTWKWLEDYRGHFYSDLLARLDFIVDGLVAVGIEPIPQVWYTPAWASVGGGGFDPPTDYADFTAFMRSLAARYKGKVRFWEIWNEPDNNNWTGTASGFVDMLHAGYDGVNAADPHAKVLCASMGNSWLADVLTAGAKNYCDYFGKHPYTAGQSPHYDAVDPQYDFAENLTNAKALLDAAGATQKVILTEFGWSTASTGWGVSQALQGHYLTQAYEYLAASFPWVEVACWYELRDGGYPKEAPTNPTSYEDNFGLVTIDFQKKSSYYSYGGLAGMWPAGWMGLEAPSVYREGQQPMFDLVITNSNGTQSHYCKKLYELEWSAVDRGGPLSLTASIPIDLVTPDITRLDKVELWYQLERIWIGRVKETPTVTLNGQAATLVCEGWIEHMGDVSFQRLYSDISYDAWDTTPPTAPPESAEFERCTKDNNNRLFFRCERGTSYDENLVSGIYYRRCHTDKINQDIYSVEWDYATGALYDGTNYAAFSLASYSNDWANMVPEWSLPGAGASTGSHDEVIAASKKSIMFYMAGTQGHTFTPASSACWAKATSVRVNGLAGFVDNYYVGDVIEDILANYVPLASTDYSKVSTGTYILPECFFETPIKPSAAVEEINKYENYNYGFWDLGSDGKPRFTYDAHDKGTVHYIASLKQCSLDLAGQSCENEYDRVRVEYQDHKTGSLRWVVRSVTNALFDSWGMHRSPDSPIQIESTSAAAANQTGDSFLEDANKPQAKGSVVVTGMVRDNTGGALPAWLMKPGKNILIRDYQADPQTLTDMASADVLARGRNIFRIRQVDSSPSKGEATIQADNPGDRLDLYLARKRLG